MQNPHSRVRARALVAATTAATFLVSPQAYALDNVAREAKHFFECLGLMFSDPDMHAQECLPNPAAPGAAMSLKGGSGVVLLPPPPPPECEFTTLAACGPCYPAG